jgi:signal transduction histidine kinase
MLAAATAPPVLIEALRIDGRDVDRPKPVTIPAGARELEIDYTATSLGREATVDALRHAEARRIEIHIEFGARNLRLEICDDGRGFTVFEAEEARQRGHFGLSGARERATSIGGRCDIRTRPEGSTVVGIELPLRESVLH